jgi:hypothetical protein
MYRKLWRNLRQNTLRQKGRTSAPYRCRERQDLNLRPLVSNEVRRTLGPPEAPERIGINFPGFSPPASVRFMLRSVRKQH